MKLKFPVRIFIAVVIACLVVVILNAQYFYARVRYALSTPQSLPNETTVHIQDSKTWQPNRLLIPSLGLELPVLYAQAKNETAFQKALQYGVVHYPGTAQAGEAGNVYIFGHSSDYLWSKGDFKSAFTLLPQLQIGQTIILTNSQGQAFTYEVVEKFVTSPNNTSVLDQDSAKRQLTLQTSYPLGTALKRYIVRSELIETK